MLWWLIACSGGDKDAVAPGPELVPLEAPALTRRLSLDLRGVLPTVEELDEVEADPAAVDELREAWLHSPEIEDRLVAFFAESWHTEVDEFQARHYDYHLDDDQEYVFERSVGQEPLRLMAYIAMNDLPWRDTVTADYTVVNDLLAGLWGMDYPEGATGWQVARYLDNRPAVGVLSTNGLWWRYYTTEFNQNRGRAAAMSRILLCADFLLRPVSFASADSLLESDDVSAMVRTEPTCLACHSSMDPLAASMFGFYWTAAYSIYEMQTYHPERERLGEALMEVSPAYFGTPISGLADMGLLIASDERFYQCTTQRMTEALLRRTTGVSDYAMLQDLREDFRAADHRLLPLISAITDTDAYRAGSLGDSATEETADREITRRMMSPKQLVATVEDLTGFHWVWQGYEMLDDDTFGYRILVGGVDGVYQLKPQQDPGVTWGLVVQRLSEAAADYVVEHELVAQDITPRLFTDVDLESTPEDAAFQSLLTDLCRRLYGPRPDAARVTALSGLWSELNALEGPAEAWKGTLSAMLRDPEFVSY